MSLTFSSFSRCIPRTAHQLVSRRYIATTQISSGEPSSISLDALQTSLNDSLTQRAPGSTKSVLDPTPSHLLNLLLADLLPPSCQAPPVTLFTTKQGSGEEWGKLLHDVMHESLPQGYHLAYFPPAVPSSQLLADGTDTLHSPGPPFVRRLWAGGSIVFNPEKRLELIRMKGVSVCTECIEDVKVKGVEGDEKVFVQIHRKIHGAGKAFGKRQPNEPGDTKDEGSSGRGETSNGNTGSELLSVSEIRNLVFMREKSEWQARADVEKPRRVLKPQLTPDWSVALTPTPNVLFRWSALTYNPHRIHLDPQYCREIEGHRDMLVHGPLSLILMISSLKSQLQPGEMIMRLDYRNLAPLYVNEELKICIKSREKKTESVMTGGSENSTDGSLSADPNQQRMYDIWIEGNGGGYAVKGTALIGRMVLPYVTEDMRKKEAKKAKKQLQMAKKWELKKMEKSKSL